jgi:hypothetical protein
MTTNANLIVSGVIKMASEVEPLLAQASGVTPDATFLHKAKCSESLQASTVEV